MNGVFRILFAMFALVGCASDEDSGPVAPPIRVQVTEYPTCLVMNFGMESADAQAGTPLVHDASIEGLEVRLDTGETVDIMEQRFFWEKDGGELLVRLGRVPRGATQVKLKGTYQAFDATGTSIGAPQAVPKQIDVSLREPLKYRLSASLSPDPDEDTMWLDIDAVLQRPLHVSGIPSAKIDRLRLEGPAGEIEPLSTQAFVATASGGKVRVKIPPLAGGSRIKLRGWWMPLRADGTPCCGEQAIPGFVDVAAKDATSQ